MEPIRSNTRRPSFRSAGNAARRICCTLLALFVFLVPWLASNAAPVITGMQGDPHTGSRIEIQGSGFGTKARAAPILYDRLDNIAAYQGLQNGDDVPVVADGDCPDCPWQETIPTDWGMRPKFYANSAHARVAGRPEYYVNRKGYFRGRNPLANLSESGLVYVSWWVRANHTLYSGSGDVVWNKLMRYTAGNGSDWEEQIEIEPQNCYGTRNGCGESGWDWFGGYAEIQPNTWHHIELMIDGGGNLRSGSGRADILIDGVRLSGTDRLYSCYGMLDHIYVWGSDPHNPSLYPSNSEILFGELYLDTCRSRVVLSNSNNYRWKNSSTTRWEIQAPVSWSDNRITIDFDRGALPSDGDVYLYVIDAAGNVSPPYRVGGGSSDAGDHSPVARLLLRNSQPNPFHADTRVSFELPEAGPVSLRVLDATGRVVRTLINESRPAGAYETAWRADDDRGRRVASGVYFYVLQANGQTVRSRVCVVE